MENKKEETTFSSFSIYQLIGLINSFSLALHHHQKQKLNKVLLCVLYVLIKLPVFSYAFQIIYDLTSHSTFISLPD
jgi:hypothetical protein